MDVDQSVALGEFRLGWRFTEARKPALTASTRARLRPLSVAAATRIASEAAQRCADDAGSARLFRSDELPGSVRRSLLELPIAAECSVIVSWDRATALATDWGSFVSHWDDFCYPASDDVTIWSPGAAWTLCYFHYEVFRFRAAQQSSGSEPPPAALWRTD